VMQRIYNGALDRPSIVQGLNAGKTPALAHLLSK